MDAATYEALPARAALNYTRNGRVHAVQKGSQCELPGKPGMVGILRAGTPHVVSLETLSVAE